MQRRGREAFLPVCWVTFPSLSLLLWALSVSPTHSALPRFLLIHSCFGHNHPTISTVFIPLPVLLLPFLPNVHSFLPSFRLFHLPFLEEE